MKFPIFTPRGTCYNRCENTDCLQSCIFSIFLYRNMAATLTTCFILLLSIGCIRALSAPLYCSYDESENHYTCDYSKMSDPANRPIDFSQFDPEPQRMTINVNGYLPYYGKCIYQGYSFFSFINFNPFMSSGLLYPYLRDDSIGHLRVVEVWFR